MEYGRRICVLAFLFFVTFAAAAQSEEENAVPYKSSNKSVFGWEKSSSHVQPEKERAYMDFGDRRIVLQPGIRLYDTHEQTAAGGSYDDTLDGGAGNDWIDGQRGHDTITGGTGSDYMRGGEGADAYFISRADLRPEEGGDAVPSDTIDDDGTGNMGKSGGRPDVIYLDRRSIATMRWIRDGNDNIWNSADGWRISYSGTTLQITHKDEAGKINVLNYSEGDYGLKLLETADDNTQPQPDAEGKTGNGDTVSGGSTEYLRAGGNSYIQSDAEGKTGDDDTVAGGGNTDLIAGGGGNDTLWADKRDSEAYKTPVRFNEDDWRGDWISGEFNNDTIHGSNREDLLFGGEGNDTVSGGAASDIILGDGSYFPSVRSRVNEGQELNIATGETYIVE